MRNVLNFLIFQAAWLITVYSASAGYPWVGIVFTGLWLVVHISLFSSHSIQELALLSSCAVVGYLADSLLVLGSMISFPEQAQLGLPTTLWMVALWINLGMTLNNSLAWLGRYPLATLALGFIGGPLAYFAGSKLSAIEIINNEVSLLSIGIMWAIAMPLLFALSAYINQSRVTVAAEEVQ